MWQLNHPLHLPNLVLSIHFVDLKESQELFQNVDFISKKTRSIYAWRAAIWVRYCKEQQTEFTVTEDKLIAYLDWLFEIDLVNKINTKKSYVPDILRDHMGSVICLWRIQTGNNPDLASPKEGTRYQAKWDEILRKYPRRERFQTRTYIPGNQPADHGMGPSMSSAQMQAGFSHGHRGTGAPTSSAAIGYAGTSGSTLFRDTRGYDYHGSQYGHDTQSGYQSRFRQSSPHVYSETPRRPSLQPQYPVALPEIAEIDWQLHWMLGGSWAHSVARFLFTISMATWVETIDVVGIHLSDIHFGSSTMAPRLPSSVLKVSILTNTVPGYRQSASHQDPIQPASRQQFSIIRSRSPLTCSWNALAMLLFHRWHVAGSPPPTFASQSWQTTLVIPAFPKGLMSPPTVGSSGSMEGGLSSEAAETGKISIAERLGLVRDLLAEERMPVKSVIRSSSLHRARQFRVDPAAIPSPLRDQRSVQAEGSWPESSAMADNDAADRLTQLSTANSGYFENHHAIQRHKVIPSESLQQTIFPWASTMMSTVPSGAGINERRNISRFLDFLLDLRVILLQDVAILRCCSQYLPQEYNMASTLNHKLFNTPDFLQFCEKMQIEAADEIHALQQCLDTAMDDDEMYQDIDRAGAGGVATLPPIMSASVRREDSGMMMSGSPGGESFSPTISPSPPKSDSRISRQHTGPFMESPRSADDHVIHTPTTAPQQTMSHSLPTRHFADMNEGYFNSAGGSASSSTPGIHGNTATAPPTVGGERSASAHLAKRRRPESNSLGFSAPQNMAVGPESTYASVSPRVGHRGTLSRHSQRLTRSPPNALMRSPGLGVSRLGGNTLPSISQFTHQNNIGGIGPNTGTCGSPMLVNSPNIGRSSGQQQAGAGGLPPLHRRDPDVYMRRPSDTATEGSAGGMGIGRDDIQRTEELGLINSLREENVYLRQQLQKLELTVEQKHAEMHNWMLQVEKHLHCKNPETLDKSADQDQGDLSQPPQPSPPSPPPQQPHADMPQHSNA
ncbi:hypothetical protein LPJ53_001560 [Coemansia erecta]|uniref:Uncharacterized protein n=1 Tax=Coemansia erecta TaxID=147472 RepID=A0A9W7Y560_9FUNG|nr:hypothetical protein LPJ53_001560 [Coemansia erecta]